MGVVRKSITFTDQQNAYIKSLIDHGLYTNDSEYIRDLIRKDQERRGQATELDRLLLEGMESGPTDATVDSIWEEALKERRDE